MTLLKPQRRCRLQYALSHSLSLSHCRDRDRDLPGPGPGPPLSSALCARRGVVSTGSQNNVTQREDKPKRHARTTGAVIKEVDAEGKGGGKKGRRKGRRKKKEDITDRSTGS